MHAILQFLARFFNQEPVFSSHGRYV